MVLADEPERQIPVAQGVYESRSYGSASDGNPQFDQIVQPVPPVVHNRLFDAESGEASARHYLPKDSVLKARGRGSDEPHKIVGENGGGFPPANQYQMREGNHLLVIDRWLSLDDVTPAAADLA
jgi:hypothetical protein